MAFLTLSFMELFHAFNVRTGRRSALGKSLFTNRTLLATFAAGLAVNVALCATPVAALFGLVNPTFNQWLIVFGASVSVIPFAEAYKAVLNALSSRKGKIQGEIGRLPRRKKRA